MAWKRGLVDFLIVAGIYFFVANFLGTFFGASILVSMSIGLRVYVCIVLLAGEAASEGYSCKKVEDCEYFGCRCIAISV